MLVVLRDDREDEGLRKGNSEDNEKHASLFRGQITTITQKSRGRTHRESVHVTARFFRFLQDGGK